MSIASLEHTQTTNPTLHQVDVWPLEDDLHGSQHLEKTLHLVPAIGRIGLVKPEAMISESAIVRCWEEQGVVKEAPRFEDQVGDASRESTFGFTVSKASYKAYEVIPEGFVEGRETEREGLSETHRLLRGYLAHGIKTGSQHSAEHEKSLHEKAQDVLDNLTFIGEKEYKEASVGIGLAWRAYLDADPKRKLCVLTEATKLERFADIKKSDDHLKNQILETFTDEELKRYSSRIVDNLEDMVDVEAEDARVILLDDWVISGRTMRSIYTAMMQVPEFRKFADADKLEINLLVASEDRINNGLHIVPGVPDEGTVPVRAYYQSHFAPTANDAHRSYVTGLHSPANYAFSEVCRKIGRRMKLGSSEGQLRPPRLISIVPDYRQSVSTIKIAANELRRLSPEERTQARTVKQAGVVAVKGKALE